MSRSSIERLAPRVRLAVDAAIREGRATTDEIVRTVEELGSKVSRSAIGRYALGVREQMKEFRRSQELARVWAGEIRDNPTSDVGRMVSQLLQAVAQRQAMEMQGAAEVETGDVARLAKALKDLTSADKTMAERASRIRREVAAEAAVAADAILRRGGMSPEAAEEIRRAILGVGGDR